MFRKCRIPAVACMCLRHLKTNCWFALSTSWSSCEDSTRFSALKLAKNAGLMMGSTHNLQIRTDPQPLILRSPPCSEVEPFSTAGNSLWWNKDIYGQKKTQHHLIWPWQTPKLVFDHIANHVLPILYKGTPPVASATLQLWRDLTPKTTLLRRLGKLIRKARRLKHRRIQW